jgi:hypothetical protein
MQLKMLNVSVMPLLVYSTGMGSTVSPIYRRRSDVGLQSTTAMPNYCYAFMMPMQRQRSPLQAPPAESDIRPGPG